MQNKPHLCERPTQDNYYHQMTRRGLYLSVLLLCGLISCQRGDQSTLCEEAIERDEGISSLRLLNLSPDFLGARRAEDMQDLLRKRGPLFRDFFGGNSLADLSRLSESLSAMVRDPHIDTLGQEVRTRFGDLSTLAQDFSIAKASLSDYDPDFLFPEVWTIVSGLYRDVYFSDSLVILSLDYFLGAEARYKPKDLPLYMLRRYVPEQLAPIFVFYTSERYNQTDPSDQTLLSEMVAMGKTYAFTMHMLPCVSDSLLMGYTTEEMYLVEENETFIWDYFLRNQLLYETRPMIKKKFIGERPKLYEIGNQYPGRVGHWLGWQIVKAYLEQQGGTKIASLKKLMKERDAKKILSLSQYNPKK